MYITMIGRYNRLCGNADLFCKLANMSKDVARAILGVSNTSTDDEINKAYKRLARHHHPDVNKSPDATIKLVELNNARDTLLFPERSGIAGDIMRQNEEEQTILNDILNREQEKADSWLDDVKIRREWSDYMSGIIAFEELQYQENIDKAPEIELKRRQYREKKEKAKQKRAK